MNSNTCDIANCSPKMPPQKREGGRLCVKMHNAGYLHAAGCDTEGRVLKGLKSIDVGGFGVGEPDGGRMRRR